MKVFHGSTSAIEKPEVRFSKRYLDFGKGFYVTTYKQQAERWAKRKALRQNKKAIVSIYDLQEDFSGFEKLEFLDDNEAWIDFVCACRNGEKIYERYDIVIGSVANDDVFRTVNMYFQGLWSKERVLKELRYYQLNDQLCLINQMLIDENLKYIESYEVV